MDFIQPEAVQMCSAQLARASDHIHRAYIEPKKIPGSVLLVARQGQTCFSDVTGLRDIERGTAMSEDTIFRIYSMTKPITSIAFMTLYERGLFALTDPVSRFIPQWKNLRVRTGGSFPQFETKVSSKEMTLLDLLRHTSGLTYDFLKQDTIDYAYRKLGVANPKPGYTLETMIDQLADLPLMFTPGEAWNYSVATDVLGYLIEVISGMSLPDYLHKTIFEPLEMADTSFTISEEKSHRLASCYIRDEQKKLLLVDDGQASSYRERSFFSGGGGLLSTSEDYLKFCKMLLSRGKSNGHRIIGSRTLALMTANHLPNNQDLAQCALGGFQQTPYDGVGFGLGFARKLGPVASHSLAADGQYFWGGLASTLFWVDPKEELIALFMTQLMPSTSFDFRAQLEAIIYAALD